MRLIKLNVWTESSGQNRYSPRIQKKVINEFFDEISQRNFAHQPAVWKWNSFIVSQIKVFNKNNVSTIIRAERFFPLNCEKEIRQNHGLCQEKTISSDYKWYCDILIHENIWGQIKGPIPVAWSNKNVQYI